MFRTAHPIIDAPAAAHGDLRGFSHRMHMGRTTRPPWDWKAALETGTKLGFALRLESGLTFVSAMLKDHSDSTSAASVGSLSPPKPMNKSSRSLHDQRSRLQGVDASYEANILATGNASYRHNAHCLYFYLTLVRRTAERGPRGKAWQQ